MTEFNLANEIPDPQIEGQKYVCISYVPHPSQNTIYFKIRGSYETISEAQERAMELAQNDQLFPIYVGEVGKFLPAQSHMINLGHLVNVSESSSNNIPINIISESSVQTYDTDSDNSSTSPTTSCGCSSIGSNTESEDDQNILPSLDSSEENITELQCLACKDRKRNSLLLPCRHLVFCLSCSQEHLKNISTCPICRKKITEVINVFIP